MFQEFFTDTLGSRYIKALLQQTPLPVFNSVVDGDSLVSGAYYVYRDFIIQCNTSGILSVDKKEDLYPSTTLYPSKYLFPKTGLRAATFYVRSLIDENNPKIMRPYKSTSNYYDSETHLYLGKYLRYIQTRTGVNLLPFYNCYNHKSIPDVQLTIGSNNTDITTDSYHKISVKRVQQQMYKVVAVPLIFGRKYRIAIDCPSRVIMRSVIYTNTLNKEYTNMLTRTEKVFSNMDFNNPIMYSVETDNYELFTQERNLYLLIQLPSDNNSSIVVLENYSPRKGIYCDSNSVREFDFINSSLLFLNTLKSYAFSDRLIEYLVGNVVSSTDSNTHNIMKVQQALADIPSKTLNKYSRALDTKDATLGIWDDRISQTILSLVHEYAQNNFILDQDGNINKDVEKSILAKGANY